MIEPQSAFTVGQRIQYHRERAGKTRAVVGGLVGRSAEWVKAVEKGRILPPRLPMLSKLAGVLKVSVRDLLDDEADQLEALTGLSHSALPAVRDALNEYALWPDVEPQPLDQLQDRLAEAWRARHASPDHRTVLGRLLPDLIRDAQNAARAYEGGQRRRAQALLAGVLGLTQFFVAYQADASLLWRVADRAVVVAQDAGDPAAGALAAWLLVEALRDAGDWDTAMRVNLDALQVTQRRLAQSGGDDLLALLGMLQTGAALTAARAGEEGRAWRHWDEADRVVDRLPTAYVHPHTWFSRPVLGFYAVSLAVELRKGGEAIRHAKRISPAAITSRPRRARHLVEVARGHHLRRAHADVIQTLHAAYDTAPETIRYNRDARGIALEMLSGSPALRRSAQDLAVKVGLVEA
jgi:transcriptional regulator with XRE-family HTH domain